MSMNNCDRMIITLDQFVEIEKWTKKNLDLIAEYKENFRPLVFNEIVIEIGTKEKKVATPVTIYINHTDTDLEIKSYIDEGFAYSARIRNSDLKVEEFNTSIIPEDGRKLAFNMMMLQLFQYEGIMSYIFHFKKDMVQKTVVNTVSKKKGKKASKRKSTVKLTRKVYTINSEISTRKVPKQRQWKGVSWTVRGHLRHYKSGKVVYIKPYIKGDKEDFKSKDYIL